MPALLPLFPAATLPAPFTHFDAATALPDFAERVRHLRRWQQAIASGYVRSRKEEVLQAEFLNLLFGDVLGYEYQATDHRQLQLELKTLTDGTKPDGALGEFVAAPGGSLGGPVRAVVELKDARTSLDAKQRGGAGKGRQETPVEQAFSYPSKFGASCRWVLVSNFLELRLYSAQDQSRAEVFNLETLPDQPEQLRRFFALLRPTQLLPPAGRAEAPLDEALHQRQQEETKITKAFYKDYSTARRQLLDHLLEQNPTVPPLELLQHTQKLLDRVIFVCFCEDKNIIPRLTFRRLLDAVRQNVFDPADDKVYRTVRGLFHSIDKGNALAGINRFNGGLFAEDAALDALHIKDVTLTPVIQLEQYDFASDLNVNILGHIFEQSLSDLEQERARLQGLPYDQKQGKRKQDGIFYTPEYITRYIVRQAVGGWLQERRREAGLDTLPDLTDDDRATIRLGTGNRLVQPSRPVQKHIAAWEQYAQALQNIRVLDPACGSGAFLNEAFGYLLREGQQVNQELAALRAGQTTLFDFDRHILQHNLYGVDLNPESVDITRLSLWLQTANPGKPLTSLDHSIRCGNSLISDAAVAGPRAFDWPSAFPEVFAQGGFDVVIGNPPYVRQELIKEYAGYLKTTYESFSGKADLFVYFFEKSLELLAHTGKLGFITSGKFLQASYGTPLLKYLTNNSQITQIIDFKDLNVFEGISAYPCIVLIDKVITTNSISLTEVDNLSFNSLESKIESIPRQIISIETFVKNGYKLINDAKSDFINKIKSKSITLKEYCGLPLVGVKSGYNEGFIAPNNLSSSSLVKPFIFGKDIKRYEPIESQFNTVFPYIYENNKQNLVNIDLYPEIENFLREKESRLINRAIIKEGLITGGKKWYEYQQINRSLDYSKEYIVYPNVSFGNNFTISRGSIIDITAFVINSNSRFLLAILNSKLTAYLVSLWAISRRGGYLEYKVQYLEKLPIPNIPPAEQQPFIAAAEALLAGHKALHEAEARAGRLVQAELGLGQPLTGKLALSQPWPAWSKALEKALGRKLTLPEKAEWLPYLEQHQQQQQQRRAALQHQDAALDQLVYQLYQLTPEEIALVEGPAAPPAPAAS